LIMYLAVLEESMVVFLVSKMSLERKSMLFTTSVRSSSTVRLGILCLRKLVAHWLGLLSVCANIC
jgi:hypothetical protein